MKHIFKSLYEWLCKPVTSGFRLKYWGIIRGYTPSIRHSLTESLLPSLRKGKDKKELFRILWNFKYLTHKEDERRKYKKRFGTWHWK